MIVVTPLEKDTVVVGQYGLCFNYIFELKYGLGPQHIVDVEMESFTDLPFKAEDGKRYRYFLCLD